MIQSIQTLRAIAALAVVAMHIPEDLAVRGYGQLPPFVRGAFGVDLFFVISGFIMVYASRHLFARKGPGLSSSCVGPRGSSRRTGPSRASSSTSLVSRSG